MAILKTYIILGLDDLYTDYCKTYVPKINYQSVFKENYDSVGEAESAIMDYYKEYPISRMQFMIVPIYKRL